MKNLFTFCATALLAFTVSAQGTSLDQGSFVGGITFNSSYENESITDDLAFTVGYAISNEITVMATRDENAVSTEDAAINLGLRYFYNGFYGQVNLNDVTGDSDSDMTLSVGSLIMIDNSMVDNLYVDPAVVLSRDSSDETEMSFTVGIGMKF